MATKIAANGMIELAAGSAGAIGADAAGAAIGVTDGSFDAPSGAVGLAGTVVGAVGPAKA
jgi:hypothetical protein